MQPLIPGKGRSKSQLWSLKLILPSDDVNTLQTGMMGDKWSVPKPSIKKKKKPLSTVDIHVVLQFY